MKTIVIQILFLIFLVSCSEKAKETKNEKILKKIDTLYNDENYLVTGSIKSKNYQIKVIKESEYDNYKNWESLISFKDDIVIAKNIEYNDVDVSRKYNPKQKFSDYKVEVYKGEFKQPNFSTNKDAYSYRTRIKEECKNGINFAGHYTLVEWGCGCPCQSNVIVDRKTGKIYDFFHTSHGTNFQKDSKLIILDYYAIDTSTNLIRLTATSDVRIGIWNKEKLKIIE